MMTKKDLIITVIIAFCVRNALAQYGKAYAQYPRIPCPDIFQYGKTSEGYFGKLSLDGITYGETLVEIDLSQPGYKNPDFAGRLELAIDLNEVPEYIESDLSIPFKVHFQFPDVIPSVTAIRLNGATICSGPKVTTRPRVNIRLKRRISISPPKSDQNGSESTTKKTMPVNNYSNQAYSSYGAYLSQYLATTPTTTTTTTAKPIQTYLSPYTATTPTTTTTTAKPIQTTERMSRPLPGTLEYINLVCGIENYNSSSTKLAFHGELIRTARFPWIVALFKKKLGEVSFKCGASLISTTTVVSAAHCFYDELHLIKDSDILVSLGRHDLTDWTDPNTIQRNVALVIQHPDYKPELLRSDADLAIVRLQQPVPFSYSIRPICLWEGPKDVEDIAGMSGTVVGWGRDENNNSISTTPKLVNATVVSDVTCLQSDDYFFFFTSNRTMCAGNLDGSGPCTGDSGSGLMLQIGNKWMLRGIVSIALSNAATPCNLKKYVVYSDTAHFLEWIRGNMLL